jgi:hypothetical protein
MRVGKAGPFTSGTSRLARGVRQPERCVVLVEMLGGLVQKTATRGGRSWKLADREKLRGQQALALVLSRQVSLRFGVFGKKTNGPPRKAGPTKARADQDALKLRTGASVVSPWTELGTREMGVTRLAS